MKNIIENYFNGSLLTLERLIEDEDMKNKLLNVVDKISKAINNGKKVLIAGNGGSAADAQHLAAEFVVRYKKDRIAFPAIALTTDTSVITASSNDYSYEDIFARQIDALGSYGDVLILFSTSGKSNNIIKAARLAKTKQIINILFTGQNKFSYSDILDLEINVPSDITSYIQECHLKLIHLICHLLDQMYEERQINYE